MSSDTVHNDTAIVTPPVSPVKPICRKCGSDNLTRDACARWDDELRDWTVSGVYDCTTCGDCLAESDDLAKWVPLTPKVA